MKLNKFLAALTVGLVLLGANNAYASAATQELMDEMMQIGAQLKACVDFSGTWKGTCETKNLLDASAKSTSEELTMTFKQVDCSALKSEEFGMSLLGSSVGKTVTSERGAFHATGSAWWMDDGQKLGVAEEFYLGLYDGKKVMKKGYMKGTYTREGDAIVGSTTTKIKKIAADGTATVIADEESSCRLELQPK